MRFIQISYNQFTQHKIQYTSPVDSMQTGEIIFPEFILISNINYRDDDLKTHKAATFKKTLNTYKSILFFTQQRQVTKIIPLGT